MKKIFLIIALLMLVNISVFTQEAERKFTLQTSPLFYMIDLVYFGVTELNDTFFVMDLEGQYKINDMINVSLTAAFFVMYYQYSPSHASTTFQIIFKPMLIYRPSRTGLKGFYLGLNPTIGWYSPDNSESYAVIGLGINTGYKWVFKNGFTLQLGGGIGKTWILPQSRQYYYDDVFNADGSIKLPNFDIQILDIKLGYSF